ncbi:MAG: hypothetical protein JXN60_01730, partial [Lentisphaerae bacterium]|nr:hypothetical protein [Lentisphaerota bacterium]
MQNKGRIRKTPRRIISYFPAVLIFLTATAFGAGIEIDIDTLLDEYQGAASVLLYAPLDGSEAARASDYILPSVALDYYQPMKMDYTNGIIGQAARCFEYFLAYPADDALDRTRGSLSFWFKYDSQSEFKQADVRWSTGRAAMINGGLFSDQLGIFNRGDDAWHNWTVTWDVKRRMKILYCDGKELKTETIIGEFAEPLLILGRGCPGWMDEVYVFSSVLCEKDILAGMERVRNGKTFVDMQDKIPKRVRYPIDIRGYGKSRAPLPDAIKWELPVIAENEKRTRYDLCGLWRAQPFGTKWKKVRLSGNNETGDMWDRGKRWGYAPAPGGWRKYGSTPGVGGMLSENGTDAIIKWNDIDVALYPCAWLERDFVLPTAGENSKAYLVLEGVHNESCFYVNDHYVGVMFQWQEREFDVTPFVKFGGDNRLTVLSGKPWNPITVKVYDKDVNLPSGINRPAYLEIRRNRDITISDVVPMPSFRRKRLDAEIVLKNFGNIKGNLTAICEIENLQSKEKMRLNPTTFILTGLPEQTERLSFQWPDPVLWFPDAPRLLNMTIALQNGDELLDRTLPLRFGFCEIWCENSDFWINGVCLNVRGYAHGIGAGVMRGADRFAETLRELKRRGMYSSLLVLWETLLQPYTEEALRVADEEGFLFLVTVGLSGGAHGTARERESYFRDWMRQYRAHPSVMLYNLSMGAYFGGQHG